MLRFTFRIRKWFVEPFKGKSLEEICNMNDGKDCPLARAYTRDEVASLLGKFHDAHFYMNHLHLIEICFFNRSLLFLIRAIQKLLFIPRTSSRSFLARRYGWNLYVKGIKP